MKLKAEKREVVGKKVKRLRSSSILPAAVFGPGYPSTNIQFDAKAFGKIFKKVGYNKFFELDLGDDKPLTALIKEVQIHPTRDYVISASIYKIQEGRKISVDVPVDFKGESPAVKQKLGFLVQQLDTIKIYCLPKDLPDNFIVDVSILENPGDTILVKDLPLGEDVELDSFVDPTSAIAYIATAQKEEVVEQTEGVGEEGEEGVDAEATEKSEDKGE